MYYLSLLVLIIAGLYTARDSHRRGRSILSSILWGIGVSLLFFIFFPLHILTRPKLRSNVRWNKRYHRGNPIDVTNETSLACPNCSKYYSGCPTTCPHCGINLKED